MCECCCICVVCFKEASGRAWASKALSFFISFSFNKRLIQGKLIKFNSKVVVSFRVS